MLLSLAFLVVASGDVVPTEENLAEWRAFLQPSSEELFWREIPWLGTFWEGVNAAQAQEKPLLLWAMNGHPLGCT